MLCAPLAHNLTRAAGALARDRHPRARGLTLRRRIVNVPARLARPPRRTLLHLPARWPWTQHWLTGVGEDLADLDNAQNPTRCGAPRGRRRGWSIDEEQTAIVEGEGPTSRRRNDMSAADLDAVPGVSVEFLDDDAETLAAGAVFDTNPLTKRETLGGLASATLSSHDCS
jgi:hypothetical protein